MRRGAPSCTMVCERAAQQHQDGHDGTVVAVAPLGRESLLRQGWIDIFHQAHR